MYGSSVTVRNERNVNVNPDDGTIFTQVTFLQIKRLYFSPNEPLALAPVEIDIVGMRKLLKAASQEFFFRVTEQFTKCRRDFEPAPLKVGVSHHHQRDLFGLRQALFALSQSILSALAFGEVNGATDVPKKGPVRSKARDPISQDPAIFAVVPPQTVFQRELLPRVE